MEEFVQEWKNYEFSNTYYMRYHADTVEFSKSGQYAMCGCYELNEETQERLGSISLFCLDSSQTFSLINELDCSGVLDISWLNGDSAVTACADGLFKLWKCDSKYLKCISETKVSNNILLSAESSHDRIIFSDSSGRLSLWNIDTAHSSTTEVATWSGHQDLAWCALFAESNQNIIYSGGDDSRLCGWDERQGFENPIFTSKHEMGVCSIRHYPLSSHLISSGCYDEVLRVWDLRMMNSQPVWLKSIGGGVWRHKWHKNAVLIAAMHAGFVILNAIHVSHHSDCPKDVISSSDALLTIRHTENLAYGVDWFMRHSYFDFAICTFYDNRVDFGKLLYN